MSGRLKSGGDTLSYSTTSGSVTYDTEKAEWPLYQPIPKLEAVQQSTGTIQKILMTVEWE